MRIILTIAINLYGFYVYSLLETGIISGTMKISPLIALAAYVGFFFLSLIVPYFICKFSNSIVGILKRFF